ncbi:MAG TPA: aminopeptidase P family protein [Bacteroidales bacterium]|nr:aminopeptidase P family protein [Bacteroidales bacterium]
MSTAPDKLVRLREALEEKGIHAYIIPSADPHLSEYVPDHWRIINWLTGFTGSSATVVITDSFAGLWTDSRYFIQAEMQLPGSGFELVKPKAFQNTDFIDWLSGSLENECTIAFDDRILSINQVRKLQKRLSSKNISFDTECDLISELWTDRPPMPDSVAFDHPLEFCGKDRMIKIAEVREKMKEMKVNYHLLTSIDDIMWMLNIRGNDIKYSPLLTSFVIVGEEQTLLFADESKIPLKLASEFDTLKIVMLPYEETAAMLSTLPKKASTLINPSSTSAGLFNAITKGMRIVEDISIPTILKAVKNKTEIANISRVMVKDGVALTKFFHWFDENHGKTEINELSISDKLLEFRSEQKNFIGPSFETIAAYGKHAAQPHYSVAKDTASIIGEKGILLIDSGGQYLDGTTDITRTIAIGVPSSQQKRDFTLVLKGMISLARAKFPLGTKGYQLDILARKALWDHGLNYGHGTGHGVGFFLNVHEGPQNIGTSAIADNKSIIEPGMLFSNEPAIYREGEYGIRTENLMICYEDEETEFGQFLKFDTVSLCHIDKTLIDKSLLDESEIGWLNFYHSEVYEKLSPFLSDSEKQWLREKTEPL